MSKATLFKGGTRVINLKNSCARVGSVNEKKAHVWLEKQGYEVFPCNHPSGPIDCIALNFKTKEILKIDIKGAGASGKSRTLEQIDLGVVFLTKKSHLSNSYRFVKHRE